MTKEELQDLETICVGEDIENGVMEKDLGRIYPNDDQSWIAGYGSGFMRGYLEASKIKK